MDNEQLLEICKAIDLSLLWENEKPTDYLRNKYVRILLPEDETARYHAYVDEHPEENETIYRLQEKLFGDVPESALAPNDDSTAPEKIYTIRKPSSSTQFFVELEPFCHWDVKSTEYIRADKAPQYKPIEEFVDDGDETPVLLFPSYRRFTAGAWAQCFVKNDDEWDEYAGQFRKIRYWVYDGVDGDEVQIDFEPTHFMELCKFSIPTTNSKADEGTVI